MLYPTLLMLILASVANLLVWLIFENATGIGWIEAAAIMFTVLLVSNVGAYQDWSKEAEFAKLDIAIKRVSMVAAVRSGENTQVLQQDVVVGDVVRVKVGDILCGDGVLLDGDDLRMDEGSLTGEIVWMRGGIFVFGCRCRATINVFICCRTAPVVLHIAPPFTRGNCLLLVLGSPPGCSLEFQRSKRYIWCSLHFPPRKGPTVTASISGPASGQDRSEPCDVDSSSETPHPS